MLSNSLRGINKKVACPNKRSTCRPVTSGLRSMYRKAWLALWTLSGVARNSPAAPSSINPSACAHREASSSSCTAYPKFSQCSFTRRRAAFVDAALVPATVKLSQ